MSSSIFDYDQYKKETRRYRDQSGYDRGDTFAKEQADRRLRARASMPDEVRQKSGKRVLRAIMAMSAILMVIFLLSLIPAVRGITDETGTVNASILAGLGASAMTVLMVSAAVYMGHHAGFLVVIGCATVSSVVWFAGLAAVVFSGKGSVVAVITMAVVSIMFGAMFGGILSQTSAVDDALLNPIELNE